MIPGLKPSFGVRAKVRVGIKTERGFPQAVDYFVCDDAGFNELAGAKPSTLRIVFPYTSPEDNFSTGLEWWARSKKGANFLACYTKDDGPRPIALRMSDMVGDAEVRGEPLKQGRVPITCAARECPIFQQSKNGCRPMGRLVFFLESGPRDGVFQIDTKSWNTIEGLTGFLSTAGNPAGRVFELSVAMVQKGRDKFPVISITEADVQVDVRKPDQVSLADALVALDAALAQDDDDYVKLQLCAALDETNPGWREQQAFIERIKEVGARAAAKGVLARNLPA